VSAPARARRLVAVVAGLVPLGLPAVAAACPACLSSAYGDRTFNWAFLGLLVMPFLVAAVIAAALLYRAGWLRVPRGDGRRARGPAHPVAREETT